MCNLTVSSFAAIFFCGSMALRRFFCMHHRPNSSFHLSQIFSCLKKMCTLLFCTSAPLPLWRSFVRVITQAHISASNRLSSTRFIAAFNSKGTEILLHLIIYAYGYVDLCSRNWFLLPPFSNKKGVSWLPLPASCRAYLLLCEPEPRFKTPPCAWRVSCDIKESGIRPDVIKDDQRIKRRWIRLQVLCGVCVVKYPVVLKIGVCWIL